MFRSASRIYLLTILLHNTAVSSENLYHFPSTIPGFLPVPTNITVHEGETARLRCRVTNLGTKTAVWRKTTDISPLTLGNILFTPNKKIELHTEVIADADREENRYDLIIKDVEREQAGVYECRVIATENYIQNITLHVLGPLEYKPELRLEGTKFVGITENIRLVCNATGLQTAPGGVDWFFNGNPISETDPRWHDRLYEVNEIPVPGRSLISKLIIEKARMSDKGHYVCRLSKLLADGFHVYILNDRKNYSVPRRDANEDKKGTSRYLKDISSGSSCWNYIPVTCITTVCFFIVYITH